MYMQNEGVKIFIQLYKEITLAVDLGSGFALENLKHPNIIVRKVVSFLEIHVKWRIQHRDARGMSLPPPPLPV